MYDLKQGNMLLQLMNQFEKKNIKSLYDTFQAKHLLEVFFEY